MMRTAHFFTILSLLFCLAVWGHFALATAEAPAPVHPRDARIVSLAPSVTEMLHCLGLGAQVVGVTRYCKWPPQAASLPKVAGFTDINYEALVRLRPTLAILPFENHSARIALQRLGISALMQDSRSIDGLLRSAAEIGVATGHADAAEALATQYRQDVRFVASRLGSGPRPSVLFCIAHEGREGNGELHAVGNDGFYSELIAAAGGRNAYSGALPFVRLSAEAVLHLNPDVILEVCPADLSDSMQRHWQVYPSLSAVRTGRVYALDYAGVVVPGPRSLALVKRLAKLIHPHLFAGQAS